MKEPGVLVIHCSDPRYQGPFHDFLSKRLRLERYALMAVPGGPQLLAELVFLPKFAWAGWRWMKFLKNLGATDRVVLIAHEDCRWYHELPLDAPVRDQQVRDLKSIEAALKERVATVSVEKYYARLDGDFEVIP
jgi:hypothetical protein